MPETKPKQGKEVHSVLAHSYLMYFFAVVAGLLLDLTIPMKLIPQSVASTIGVVFLLLAPVLIIWAQRTSASLVHEKSPMPKDFRKGPYAFLRTPTHLGLDLLVIGFGFLLNSMFIVILSIVSYFVTRFFFVRKEERILSAKYGKQFNTYKAAVRIR